MRKKPRRIARRISGTPMKGIGAVGTTLVGWLVVVERECVCVSV
jgi:hypothetical protein